MKSNVWSEWLDPPTDGRTGGGLPPPPDPPHCFRLRRYGRRNFRPKNFSAEKVFGRNFFRPKKNSADNFSDEKFSAENFAVRIAKGGSNGEGPGGTGAPPRLSERLIYRFVGFCVAKITEAPL